MSKVNHDHLFIVAAGILFISAFVFTLGLSGAVNMPTGMVTEVTKISCIDSEIPSTPYIAGTINVTYLNMTTGVEENILLTDMCDGKNSVLEYACKGNVPIKYITNCPGGKVCSNGVCGISLSQGCVDTDGGLNYSVKGTASAMNPINGQQIIKIDACVTNENGLTEELDEAYCHNGVPTIHRIPCAGGCDGPNGKCISDVCTETDNGSDIYNYGVTTGVSTSGVGNQVEDDYCVNATHINEFWCSEINPMYWNGGQFECPEGCNFETNECNGDEPPVECTDTDGGNNIFVLGTASNGIISKTDVCVGTNNINESFCEGSDVVVNTISCPTGSSCQSGKCLTNYGSSFISVWNTSDISSGSSNANQIKLPLESTGTYNFNVQWGDGTSSTITSYNQAEVTHTYAQEGVYTINITGAIKGFRFANSGDRLKIITIGNWGPLNVGNNGAYFYGCANMNSFATDNLDTTGTTNFTRMFANASKFNGNINGWDMSDAIYMTAMFESANKFNQPIGNWNTGNVINMGAMFRFAYRFNQSIGSWDTHNVTYMGSMFVDAYYFNQDVSSWDTSKVTIMGYMFKRSAFNQDIGSWDIQNVTSMYDMLTYSDLSTSNYDALLIGWGEQNVKQGVIFGAENTQYSTAGESARTHLINEHGWIITDGGMVGQNPVEAGDVKMQTDATSGGIAAGDKTASTPISGTTQTTSNSGMAYAPPPSTNTLNKTNITCYDTDGGINKYVLGTASGTNFNGSIAFNDTCYDNYTVREAYCDGMGPVTGLYSCGSGYICSQGRCQVQKTTNTTTTTTATSPTLTKTETTTTTQSASGTPTSTQVATIGLTCSCNMGTICPWSTCDKADASCQCCIGTCPGAGCDLSGSGKCQNSIVYIR